MRAIVFGAGGQLGIDLVREARRRGHSVRAWPHFRFDVSNEVAVRAEIVGRRPDWVLNSAAYNHVDDAERHPEVAMQVNGCAVRSMARACQEAQAVLVHFSTDYVFPGDKGSPYVEGDPTGPLSSYGQSKLAGESFARSCSSHYVLRLAGVYGPPGRYTNRGNFVEFTLRKCVEDVRFGVVADQVTSPTFGPAVARRTLDILEGGVPFGLYHLAGGEAVSWFDFAGRIATAAGFSARISTTRLAAYPALAQRPAYSALSNVAIEAAGILRMPGIDRCLRDYLVLRKQEPVELLPDL